MNSSSEWREVDLPDVLTFREGPGIMARDFRATGIPLIRVAGLKRGNSLLTDCNYLDPEAVEQRWSHFRLREGDALLSTSASLGEVAVVDQSSTGAVPYTGIISFRPKGADVIPEVIPYILRSPMFRAQTEAAGVGSVIRHFGPTHLKKMRLLLPPLTEQRAISNLLGALDDKIAVNDRIAETSLELAITMYGELSASWPGVAARDSATWLSGGTPKTSEPAYWDGDIPWISAKSLRSPWIFESDRNVTQTGANNGTRWAREGSVVFVVRGSSLDTDFRIGLTIRDVTFGQDCKALIPREGIDPTVLFLAFKSRTSDVLKLVDHTGHGAGRLSTDLIGGLEIRLPDPTHNEYAVQQLKPLVCLGAEKRQENRVLAQLRDTLLPKLMSGEIRIRDAEKVVEEAT